MLEQRPAARQLKCGSDGGVFTETTNTGRNDEGKQVANLVNFYSRSVEELNYIHNNTL